LQPLPAGLFPVFEEAVRTVHRELRAIRVSPEWPLDKA
jgi:hypothetical protein